MSGPLLSGLANPTMISMLAAATDAIPVYSVLGTLFLVLLRLLHLLVQQNRTGRENVQADLKDCREEKALILTENRDLRKQLRDCEEGRMRDRRGLSGNDGG